MFPCVRFNDDDDDDGGGGGGELIKRKPVHIFPSKFDETNWCGQMFVSVNCDKI